MTIKVHQLTAPLKEVENYLRQDIPLNGLPLYDLTLAWDSSEWFIAQRNNHLLGCLIVYTGSRGMNSFFTRGSSTAVEKLVTFMPYPSIFAIIPQEHRPIVVKHYQFLSEGTFLLMNLEESRCKMPQLHETIRLSSTDLPEIDNFYSISTAGAWNPAQLAIGPFYGIRQENKLVSICGTIGVYRANPGVAVIGNLVTLPAYQNRGYGTSVLCAVIQELFKNYQYVTLMVDSTNRGALCIYERLGFVVHTKFQIGVCQRRKPV
ncbi:MAG: GNAT family N-acetyltransferase [Promethearchaeota archaeon]